MFYFLFFFSFLRDKHTQSHTQRGEGNRSLNCDMGIFVYVCKSRVPHTHTHTQAGVKAVVFCVPYINKYVPIY